MTLTPNIGCSVDLLYLSCEITNFDYNILKFNAGIWKFKPCGTVLLFSSGKLVIVGVKCEKDAERILATVNLKLKELDYKCFSIFEINVKNVVGLLKQT